MSALKRFNKEQVASGVSLALAALLLGTGILGGTPIEPVRVPPEQERVYTGPPVRGVEFVAPKYDVYATGRNPFEGSATSQLPIPDIRPPEPRADDLVAPSLRPGPAYEALNRSAVATKYRVLKAGAPAFADADLPTQPEFDELKALAEPEMPPVMDQRHEREIPNDVVHRVGKRPIEGKVLVIDNARKVVKVKETTSTGGVSVVDVPFSEIPIDPDNKPEMWIEYGDTNEEKYKRLAAKIGEMDVARHLRLARWAREKGMNPEARQEYRLAIEAAKKTHQYKAEFLAAVREMGELAASISDFDGALGLYLEMAALPTFDKPEMLARAGECLRAVGVHEGALELYRASINESPRYVRGRVAMARVLLELGRDAEARSALAELPKYIVRETPPADIIEGAVVGGLCALRGADLAKARSDLETVLKLDANHAEARNALGVVSVLEGKAKEGSALFVAAVKSNQYLVDAWLNLAAMYLSANRVAEAEALYGCAAVRDPSSAEPSVGLALAQVLKGSAKDAPAALDAALRTDPRHSFAHYAYGALLAEAGGPDDAAKSLDHFAASLQAEYFFLPAYHGAAMGYLALARRLEREAAGAEEKPELAAELREKSRAQLVHAETLLNTIRQFDPGRVTTLIALGCVYAAQGRLDESTQSFGDASSKIGAPDALVLHGMGWAIYRHGPGDAKQRIESAMGQFRQASRLPGTDPWIKEAGEAVKQCTEWLETQVRLADRFEGRDGEKVGGGWFEFERFGVKISVDKGRLKFAGTQADRDLEVTRLERGVPRDTFLSFEATLYADSTSKCDFGMAVQFAKLGVKDGDPWQTLWVGFDARGTLRQVTQTTRDAAGGRLDTAMEVKAPIADPKSVRIRIERREKERNQKVFAILVWDPTKSEWALGYEVPYAEQGPNKEYRVTIWGRAMKGADYAFQADNVRILEKIRR